MLRLYTDDSKGLNVCVPEEKKLTSDPVVVLVLSIAFVFSVILLHILAKVFRYFIK